MIIVNGHMYLSEYLLDSEAAFIILLPIFIFLCFKLKKQNRMTLVRFSELFLFFIYLHFVIGLTLFPINIISPTNKIFKLGFGHQYLGNLNILTLFDADSYQIFGNIALLFPLAIFVASLFKIDTFKRSLIIGLAATFSIEIMQFIMNYFYLGNRTFDVDDLVFNTLGYLLGFLAYKLIAKIFKIDSDHLLLFNS